MTMNREAARDEIKRVIPINRYAQKSRAGGLYVCPHCGSGEGPHGTGAVKLYLDTNTASCHACKKAVDQFDFYMHQNGADYNTALKALADEAGIEIERYNKPSDRPGAARKPQTERGIENKDGVSKMREIATHRTIETNYRDYYVSCFNRLHDPAAVSYLTGRGISMETAETYGLGFDPVADPAGTGHPAPRIIIPTTEEHYVARAIDENTPKAYSKMSPKGSTLGIFNYLVLQNQEVQEVFVCEGAFDALSVLEMGAAAVAIDGAGVAKKFVQQLKEQQKADQQTKATLILGLDNDGAGKEARDTIRKGLEQLNISYITADICGDYKDPNEYLQHDRAGFFKAVQEAQRKAGQKPDNVSFYIDSLMSDDLEAFRSDIMTGYENLDSESGGLYAGLYVIAATSSLGKTTFAHQMADQIAEAGNDVLFFSLEQSRLELVTKSLARITAQNDLETAVTSLSIRKGYFPQQVQKAAQEYKERVADRVSIIEGNFNCDISFIGDYVRRYIERNKTKPVLIIDYLQILQPETEKNGRQQTTKEVVDSTVTMLKRISREQGLTIFAICSVNRTNYLTPIDFESLKESGNIEYTADVIWGLQLHCLSDDPIFEMEKNVKKKREKVKAEKSKTPRLIDLVRLKNRYGIATYTFSFEYYPENDWFKPIEKEKPKKAGRRI